MVRLRERRGKDNAHLHTQGSLEEGADPETELVEWRVGSGECLACILELIGEEIVEALCGCRETALSVVVIGGHGGGR